MEEALTKRGDLLQVIHKKELEGPVEEEGKVRKNSRMWPDLLERSLEKNSACFATPKGAHLSKGKTEKRTFTETEEREGPEIWASIVSGLKSEQEKRFLCQQASSRFSNTDSARNGVKKTCHSQGDQELGPSVTA